MLKAFEDYFKLYCLKKYGGKGHVVRLTTSYYYEGLPKGSICLGWNKKKTVVCSKSVLKVLNVKEVEKMRKKIEQ